MEINFKGRVKTIILNPFDEFIVVCKENVELILTPELIILERNANNIRLKSKEKYNSQFYQNRKEITKFINFV